jgi:hypothetical protein
MSAASREQVAALIARVLKQHLGPGEHREVVAGWETVLSFDFWYRLTRGHRLSRPAVRRVIVQSLNAIAHPQDASQPTASSRRKR